MRTPLLLSLLVAARAYGGETPAPPPTPTPPPSAAPAPTTTPALALVPTGELTVRDKMLAKLLASTPPAPPPKLPSEQPARDPDAPPPILMAPVVVVEESRRARELRTIIERQIQEKKDDKFDPIKGGRIYKNFGTWWTPGGAWC